MVEEFLKEVEKYRKELSAASNNKDYIHDACQTLKKALQFEPSLSGEIIEDTLSSCENTLFHRLNDAEFLDKNAMEKAGEMSINKQSCENLIKDIKSELRKKELYKKCVIEKNKQIIQGFWDKEAKNLLYSLPLTLDDIKDLRTLYNAIRSGLI